MPNLLVSALLSSLSFASSSRNSLIVLSLPSMVASLDLISSALLAFRLSSSAVRSLYFASPIERHVPDRFVFLLPVGPGEENDHDHRCDGNAEHEVEKHEDFSDSCHNRFSRAVQCTVRTAYRLKSVMAVPVPNAAFPPTSACLYSEMYLSVNPYRGQGPHPPFLILILILMFFPSDGDNRTCLVDYDYDYDFRRNPRPDLLQFTIPRGSKSH